MTNAAPRPWPVATAAVLCYVAAGLLAVRAAYFLLMRVAPVADVQSMMAEGMDQLTGPTIEHAYSEFAQYTAILTAFAVLYAVFGAFLLRGEYLPAVRLTATITTAINAVGFLYVAVAGAGGMFRPAAEKFEVTALFVLLLVNLLFLFSGRSAAWVRSHPET